MIPSAPLPQKTDAGFLTECAARACAVPAAQVEMEEPAVVLTPGERANEEPVPEQEEPEAAAPARSVPTTADLERTEAAAPNLAVPTAGQLELARAKPCEASQSNLKPHLLLGLSIEGIEQHIASLPQDAVEQCNRGNPGYDPNSEDNGYTNQFHIAKASEGDGLAMCERLQKQGSPHVGKATVFVSWFLKTPLTTLVDALREFLRQKQLPLDTKFWVCDFVIRQATRQLAAADNDVKRLGDCVRAVGHTVLLLEPWHAPAPLQRAYCIKEVYHTQASGAQFDVVMSSAQQAAFDTALVRDFYSIQMSLSKVDVRTATCMKPEDTKAILDELEQGVGLVECNTLVIGLLREALVAQARAALGRLPAAERGTRWAGWGRRGRYSRRTCRRAGRRWATATRTR
eukprot:scaffold18446_cov69-Phaeocystis_antarctica.AAC.1